jgi:hypothetical protein
LARTHSLDHDAREAEIGQGGEQTAVVADPHLQERHGGRLVRQRTGQGEAAAGSQENPGLALDHETGRAGER